MTIVDRPSPIVDYKKGLLLAGDNAQLQAVANAMHVKSPWAETAADAVIAHAIAVLDLAMTEVTAETHRKVLGALLR